MRSKNVVFAMLCALLVGLCMSGVPQKVYANSLDTDYSWSEYLIDNGALLEYNATNGNSGVLSDVINSDEAVIVVSMYGSVVLMSFDSVTGSDIEFIVSNNALYVVSNGEYVLKNFMYQGDSWLFPGSVTKGPEMELTTFTNLNDVVLYSNLNITNEVVGGEVLYYANGYEVIEDEQESSADYTEILEHIFAVEQAQAEAIAEIKQVQEDSFVQLQTLNGSLITIVVFLVLNFCWSCMRQWRKNILKMGE